jgi:hypothetical protein
MRKIAVVGGGWYGCHIASHFISLGFDVTLFEQHDTLLWEASGNNQFRLHQGFHYPRDSQTRMQSRDGYHRFMERYLDLSEPVENNLYAVPTGNSLIDFDTYRGIMAMSGISFREIDPRSFGFSKIDGLLNTEERVILLEKARHYFMDMLSGSTEFGTTVTTLRVEDETVTVNGRKFDYVVDATWGHLTPISNVFYEPTLLLYFEPKEAGLPAITCVDGPLYSVYPTESPDLVTLSSVPHTPLGRFASSGSARYFLNGVKSDLVDKKRQQMVYQALENVPHFNDLYRYMGPQFAIKTKPIGASDNRSCQVIQRGRLFSVLSGKIDTIFFAVERILEKMDATTAKPPENVRSALRQRINREVNIITTKDKAMNSALIGHTGFVGSNLAAKSAFTHSYNSKNIEEIRGQHFDQVICAGVNAVKWKANKEPEADWQAIEKLISPLQDVTADRFILISTVDVYKNPNGVAEDSTEFEQEAAYGHHRRQFEEFITRKFENAQIVRLPALFGPGLKKNVIFDLMNDNMLDSINFDAEFQWYNVERLAEDLEVIKKSDIPLINIAIEPVSTRSIVEAAFPGKLHTSVRKDGIPPRYDMQTNYAGVLGGEGRYHIPSDMVLRDISSFVREEMAR